MVTLSDTQAIGEMAELLYDFLPGNPHPYADQSLSFPAVARKAGVGQFWSGGSKKPALTKLLISTLDNRRSAFCALILGIVQNGMIYRNSKGSPITKEEIRHLNELVAKVGFKIPELWDPKFLDALPSSSVQVTAPPPPARPDNQALKQQYEQLRNLEPHQRGYAFEQFLNEWFRQEGLSPRGPFRLTGEQIDGSFVIDSNTYLLEAKWHSQQTQEKDLLVFHGKVEGKSSWSRGIFISHSGFTQESMTSFLRGRSTKIIGMDGQDIYFVLEGKMSLTEAIHRKTRRAAETGEFYVSVYELSLEG